MCRKETAHSLTLQGGVHILSLGGALTTYTPKLSPKIISRPGGGLALTASPWLRLCPARLLRL